MNELCEYQNARCNDKNYRRLFNLRSKIFVYQCGIRVRK